MEITPEQRTKLGKLVTLANFLDDLPHDKFHMGLWTARDFTATRCGTAGCAGGWAGTIFAKEGFRFIGDCGINGSLVFDDYEGHEAFAEFFGIEYDEAWAITEELGHSKPWSGSAGFSGYCCEYELQLISDITPRHAADRIRKVVARYDASLLEDKSKPVGAELAAIK